MRITSLERYGLRCMITLANKEPGGQLSIPEIAELEGLSVPYVSKLLSVLRKAGLVTAVRGRGGGFGVSRKLKDITLLDILTALDGPFLPPDHCTKFTGQREECVHIDSCSVYDVLNNLAVLIESALKKTTLESLINSNSSSCSSSSPIFTESLIAGIKLSSSNKTLTIDDNQ